jgi:hypothetical protein
MLRAKRCKYFFMNTCSFDAKTIFLNDQKRQTMSFQRWFVKVIFFKKKLGEGVRWVVEFLLHVLHSAVNNKEGK